ncbi:MAG: hypothetical protein J0L58_17330 [Burkholderiales bacterium]|nr:hypothetical protein [Burkholderiales bacterium]
MSLNSILFVSLFGTAAYLNGRFLVSPIQFLVAKTWAAKGLVLACFLANAGLMHFVHFDLMVLLISWLPGLAATVAIKLLRRS